MPRPEDRPSLESMDSESRDLSDKLERQREFRRTERRETIKNEEARAFSHESRTGKLARMQVMVHQKTASFDRWVKNAPTEERSRGEIKMEEMTSIIRTYRGIEEEETPDSKKHWSDRCAAKITISSLIVMNSVLIGLEVDMCDEEGQDRHVAWIVLEAFFCLAFIAELGVKVQVHTWKWMIHGCWNLAATAAAFCLLLGFSLSMLDVANPLRFLSLIRVGSLFKLVKVLKRFSYLDGLRGVLQAFNVSKLTIVWTVLQMVIFIYVCAVLLTYQIGHNPAIYDDYRKWSGGWNSEEFFGTIGRSMYTLLQFTSLDSWSSQVARHVITNQPLMAVVILIFIVLIVFGLLNIVASVIVENMLEMARGAQASEQARVDRQRQDELLILETVFEECDKDHGGSITQEEFLEACKEPEVAWQMRQLGLPVADASKLFGILDGDGSRSLTMQEFIQGCTKLKGPAQSKDLLALQAQADSLSFKMDGLEETLDETERMMMSLDELTSRSSRRFPPCLEGTRRKVAAAVGGLKPIVQPARELPGTNVKNEPLSLGNRPAVPQLPALLR